jgi:hypothetical protein
MPPTSPEYGSGDQRVFGNLKNLMVGIVSRKVLRGIGGLIQMEFILIIICWVKLRSLVQIQTQCNDKLVKSKCYKWELKQERKGLE